jgi:predicted amidophosphoribosyltransferase
MPLPISREAILLLMCLVPVAAVFVVSFLMKLTGEKKTCPFCAEELRMDAKVCRQCRRSLNFSREV